MVPHAELSRILGVTEPFDECVLVFGGAGNRLANELRLLDEHAEHDAHQAKRGGILRHQRFGAREIRELVLDWAGRVPVDLLELGDVCEEALDDGLEKRLFAAEVVVDGPLGRAGELGDAVHARAFVTFITKRPRGGE